MSIPAMASLGALSFLKKLSSRLLYRNMGAKSRRIRRYPFVSGKMSASAPRIRARGPQKNSPITKKNTEAVSYTHLDVYKRHSHGYGISKIRAAVERYRGTLDIRYDKEEFDVTIFIAARAEWTPERAV